MAKILYVDDNETLRKVVCAYLEGMGGHETYSLENPFGGLQFLEENRCDIVITDFQMPDMNGVEFCLEIKKRYPELPVILMSAMTHILDKQDLKRAGIAHVIDKGASPRRLIRAVESLVPASSLSPSVTPETLATGQATVEFALLTPIILIFILVTIQLGLVLNMYIGAQQLTREATRYIAVHPSYTDATIHSYVQRITPTTIGYSNLTYSIQPAYASRTSGTALTVTLSVNVANKIFLPDTFFGLTMPTTLPSLRAVMIAE